MPNLTTTFSPSVNIQRDKEKDLNYVVTPNAVNIYKEIVGKINSGIHSFSIIGSYGTGKSTFLWALRKNLKREKFYFEPLNGEFKNINDFNFDFIVGDYNSLISGIGDHLGLGKNPAVDDILEHIQEKQEAFKKANKYWVLVIDEFGKYLEYAAHHNPEKELYLIQQIAEYANDNDKNLLFVNTLHQAFDSYAHGLDLQQRKEWDKVRGRLKELTFNEPVEQLLHIATEYLQDYDKKVKKNDIDDLLNVVIQSRAFPLKNDLSSQLANNLYPLDPLSAGILAQALQTYGQNERSLFTFLQSDEFLGVNNFDRSSNPFYNLACVYDYLIYNHHSYISSKYNPHYVQWRSIKSAIERIESRFDGDVSAYKKLVKIIGLLNIFSSKGAQIDRNFLKSYTDLSVGISDVSSLIKDLEKKQIIRYRSHRGQFVLFEGTDIDIELELQNASKEIDPIKDVVSYLKKYFSFPYLPAKRVYYKKGNPRFFEFILSEKPAEKNPEQPVDGYINLVFQSTVKNVKETSIDTEEIELRDQPKPILYGVFHNSKQIEDQLFLIERTRYLINQLEYDKVAKNELKDLLESQIEDLNHQVLNSIYSENENITWIYNGNEIDINSSRDLNKYLSNICEDVYHKAPVFKNELINKHKVSPAIYHPRKKLLKALVNKVHQEKLGFEEDKFPAEKTIYLSLLYNTGMHVKRDGRCTLGAPHKEEGSLNDLWDVSDEFFDSTKSGKKNLNEFKKILKSPPLGLKRGFIEFWIPIFLLAKKDEFALYYEGSYIPELSYEIVNLIQRNPKIFELKAFHIDGIKQEVFARYRSLIGKNSNAGFTNKNFVETIRPFLLVFNDLNEYGRTTKRISKEAQRLRKAIKTAKDPEETFFVDFPRALGFTRLKELSREEQLQDFVYELDKCVDELKNSYGNLLDRVEACLLNALGLENESFSDYQKILKKRYSDLKSYRLTPYQKRFYGRLLSQQKNREKWLSAVAFTVLDKPLEQIRDDEERLLLDRLPRQIEELDNLSDLASLHIDDEKEEAIKLNISSLNADTIEHTIRVSKSKIKQHEDLKDSLLKELKNVNQNESIAILSKIMRELINYE